VAIRFVEEMAQAHGEGIKPAVESDSCNVLRTAGKLQMKRPFLKLSRGLWGLNISGIAVICAFTATGFLGGLSWVFDTTANFRVQYLVCLVVAAIFYLIGRKWRWAVLSGIFALVNIGEILPSFIGPSRQATAPSNSVTVLLANVLSSNKHYEKVEKLVRSVDPDIIVVVEATEDWMRALAQFEEKYPHVVSRPREDNFGIAVFSRFPFEKSEILQIGDWHLPSAMARLRIDDREFTLVATHPAPPVGGARFGHRNRQLEAVAEYVRSVKGPVILLGDLNTTPWSPHFKKLLRRGGLLDSRRRHGIQATWPAQTLLPLFRIPLDHILHSPGIAILHREVGPDIGSDHLPVIAEFSLVDAER